MSGNRNPKRQRPGDARSGINDDEKPDLRVQFWLPSEDVDLVVLAFYMQNFIDASATMQPGSHWMNNKEFGFYIKSRAGLDEEDVVAIKHDSRDWYRESRRRNVRYVDSDTARLRLKRGRPERRSAPYSEREPSLGSLPSNTQTGTSLEEKSPASVLQRHQSSEPKSIPGADDSKRPGAPAYSVSYTNTAKVTYSGASPPYGQNVSVPQYGPSASDPSFRSAAGQRKIEETSYDDDDPNRMDYEKGPRQPTTTDTPGFQSMYATAGPTRHDSRDNRSADEQRRVYDYNRGYQR